MTGCVLLDEDYHVHSTFSDGASTLSDNMHVARERALRTLCLVDHVRADTAWVREFAAAVSEFRSPHGPRVMAGVEAKIIDSSGLLDLPAGLDEVAGVDLVLIADHRFPAEHGPLHPEQVRAAIAAGDMAAGEAIECLIEATVNAASLRAGSLIAHLFSVLPKIGLDEAQVPGTLLRDLAKRLVRAGAMVEVNEKWRCPSARTLSVMAGADVHLVAGTDSHNCQDIGIYDSVRKTVSALG